MQPPAYLYDSIIGAGFSEHFFALCAKAGFVPRISQEASSLATLFGLVSAGSGLAPLLRALTRLHPVSYHLPAARR